MTSDTAASGFGSDLSDELYAALAECDRIAVRSVLERALAAMAPLAVAETLLGPTLNRIGDAWAAGEAALAQLYLGGRICEQMLDELLPQAGPLRTDAPRLAIAVLADHHVLGKRIVSSCLRIAGYPVLDYGAGLGAAELARRAREDDLDALLVSVLMLPSALQVEAVTAALRDHPVKVFVGGAPFRFDPLLWRAVGADAMGDDAADALTLVQGLAGRTR